MSEKNTGGGAFPLSVDNYEDVKDHPAKGMTLRDYFAGVAIQSMLLDIESNIYDAAADAYSIADAMLKERSK